MARLPDRAQKGTNLQHGDRISSGSPYSPSWRQRVHFSHWRDENSHWHINCIHGKQGQSKPMKWKQEYNTVKQWTLRSVRSGLQSLSLIMSHWIWVWISVGLGAHCMGCNTHMISEIESASLGISLCWVRYCRKIVIIHFKEHTVWFKKGHNGSTDIIQCSVHSYSWTGNASVYHSGVDGCSRKNFLTGDHCLIPVWWWTAVSMGII